MAALRVDWYSLISIRTGVELTFQSCIVKNCEKNLLVLVSLKGPEWVGLRGRIF